MRFLRGSSMWVFVVPAALVLVGAAPVGAAVTQRPITATSSALYSHEVAHATSSVAWTYTVNTTTDATLLNGAAAHKCEDTGDVHQCSIRAAIEVANNDMSTAAYWDVIKLPTGVYDLNPAVDASSLDIDFPAGGGLSIDGAGSAKSVLSGEALQFSAGLLAINTAATSVEINAVGFTGGRDQHGAGINLSTLGSLYISSCAFVENRATEQGGAIYAQGQSSLNIANSQFSSNLAVSGGGAIYSNSTFPMVLTGNTFDDNFVSGLGADDAGGALSSQGYVDSENDTFFNNKAYGAGGAVDALGDYSAQGDSYIGNHSFEYEGGAIYATGQLSVKQSRIENNSAGENGGAIVPTVSGTFTSDAFSGNSSEQNAGDIFDNSSVTILDSTFLKSTAEAEGGSIFESHGATLTMSGDMVQDGIANSPTDEQGGGGLDLNGVASLSDVTMTGNRVPSPDGYGGSILCINQCQLTLNGSLILGGAAYAGGAIAVTQSSTMLMDDTNLDGNDASVGGGILDDQSSDLQIDDSTVDANNALLRGGGIAVEQGGTLAMQNSTVARNRVPIFNGRGGGIEFSNSSGEQNDSLVNDTVSDNVAYIGAGIFANDVALGVQSSTITANSYGSNLDNGGGLFSDGKAVVSSTDSIWAGNEGLQCAGAPISDSGGFNLDSDNSCRLSSAGDLINRPALMGTLGSFGGPTPTVEPFSTSPAIGNGGTSCPTVDQRGVGVVKGQPCDIGSVFVQKSAISMAEGPTTLRKGDEETEKFVVLVVPEVASERPTGSVVVSSGVKTICVIELRPVVGSKKGDSTGACSPSASTLKTGTFHVFAVFNPSGFLARSTSLARKLKVVA